MRLASVPDPIIEHPRDAIIKVSTCAICGSDLHLFDGFMPGMESGDIMGPEFMGEVVEVGNENSALKIGDRVVVPFTSHATRSFDAIYDRAKQAVMLETDRPHVLREMIYVCRPAGTLSVPGVYGGLIDKIPFGASMNKGLTWRMGQTHVNRWTDDLLRRIQDARSIRRS